MTRRSIKQAEELLLQQYNDRLKVQGVTPDQAAALQGTDGTPSESNRYVTDSDVISFVAGPATAVSSNIAEFDGATGKIIKDGLLTHANVDNAVSLKHTSGADTTLGAVGAKNPPIDADLAIYRDSTASNVLVTSTWTQVKSFFKTYFDTLYVVVTGRYRYAAALADGATVTLPTITANYPANGVITLAHASDGSIVGEAHFFFGSSGVVQIIEGTTATIEANAATAGKVSIGAAVSANPVVIKNNLGGGVSVNAMITLWYG